MTGREPVYAVAGVRTMGSASDDAGSPMLPSEETKPAFDKGIVAGQISKRAVKILAAHTGRGPTSVRTYINEDLVTIVCKNLLTSGERNLTDHGKLDAVLEGRRAYQETMEGELITAVEELVGRRVIAFLSANHLEPDVEIESFVLERHADA